MSRLVTAEAILGFLAAAAILSAMALFTDTASVPGNTISTGTVNIGTSPTSAVITLGNMAPGDTVDSQLEVRNDGTLQLRYAVTASSTNGDGKNLRDALTMTIKLKQAPTCTETLDDPGRPTLYSGSLNPVGGKVIGDPAGGGQAGDRVLDGGVQEDLCFRVALPIGSGNSLQNAAVTATFTFQAEQTVNNP